MNNIELAARMFCLGRKEGLHQSKVMRMEVEGSARGPLQGLSHALADLSMEHGLSENMCQKIEDFAENNHPWR
jgi:hypothetical protein